MDVDDRGLFDSPIELLSEMENREEGAPWLLDSMQ